MPFVLCPQIFCSFLFSLALLPSIEGQHFGEAQGEGLKAQLLANLNRYSGHGERVDEGPMESLGARKEATISTMPATHSATESSVDPFSSLLALFRPSPSPALSPQPLLSPLIPIGAPSICPPQPITAPNPQQMPPQDFPLSERRYHQQKSTAISPRSFPITGSDQQQNNKDKWGRTMAEVIGEWRRRMYKVLRTARKERLRDGKANSGEMGSSSDDAVDDQLQHNHHHPHHQRPLVLFGPPPAVIDARRATNLARLFGVENTRNGTAGRGATMVPLRKNLHSFELRTITGQRVLKTISRKKTTTTTTTMAQRKESEEREEEEDEVYNEVIEEEEEGEEKEEGERGRVDKEEREEKRKRRPKDDDDEREAEDRFEIVYLPALKSASKRKLIRAKATKATKGDTDGRTEERGGDQSTKRQPPTPAGPMPLAQQPQHAAAAPAPIVPFLSVPSPSFPSPPPALSVTPPTLLPLQFPTLLPPIVPSLTVVPPPPPSPVVQLSHLIATPSLPVRPALSQLPEGDFLKELENVPEDYVDERERTPNFVHLPCLRDRSASSPTALSDGRPLPHGTIPAGCQKNEMALPARKAQPGPTVVKTPTTGIFFEASPEEADGTMRNLLWDENREMCNSARLRALIQRSIVPSNVEKSKRRLQQQAEQQFGTFYNVICGTGFFSYIAHTDEFCLMAVHDMNCYVFSPVCSTQVTIASGISRQKERRKRARGAFNANRTKRTQRHLHYSAQRLRAFLNRN